MTLRNMTPQQAFTAAVCGLASQNWERSTRPHPIGINACRYRGDDGRRCAVGWLIPDELYTEEMEGEAADGVADLLGVTDRALVVLLEDMQDTHDTSRSYLSMREHFKRIADRYGLAWPEGL
jgi:hypothetical protein